MIKFIIAAVVTLAACSALAMESSRGKIGSMDSSSERTSPTADEAWVRIEATEQVAPPKEK